MCRFLPQLCRYCAPSQTFASLLHLQAFPKAVSNTSRSADSGARDNRNAEHLLVTLYPLFTSIHAASAFVTWMYPATADPLFNAQ